MIQSDFDPATLYDRVSVAWQQVFGEELRYGVFRTESEPLETATAELTERMVAAADLDEGLSVLDVGCGTGREACRLAGRFGVRVLGITTSQAGVTAARQRAVVAGVSDLVAFEIGDGMDNLLPSESFDRVWLLESSHVMRDRGAVVAECARVLRPGGRFVLCDIIRRRVITFLEIRRRRHEFETLREAFGDARMEPLETYRRLAEQSGLVVDRCDDLTTETLPTFDRWRRTAAHHALDLARDLGEDGVSAFLRSTDLLEAFWRDGTFGYGLIAAAKP
jgi:27-O-demethylrifamycin SV methyltransferase